jgi:predicted nucleotidyltransferase
MTQKEFQNKIKQKALEVDSNAEVILYGSRARGEERKNSDWDILILTEIKGYKPKDIRIFIKKILELEIETGEVISADVYSKEEWFQKYRLSELYRNVSEEGIKL